VTVEVDGAMRPRAPPERRDSFHELRMTSNELIGALFEAVDGAADASPNNTFEFAGWLRIADVQSVAAGCWLAATPLSHTRQSPAGGYADFGMSAFSARREYCCAPSGAARKAAKKTNPSVERETCTTILQDSERASFKGRRACRSSHDQSPRRTPMPFLPVPGRKGHA
jgi:hypothetical protein